MKFKKILKSRSLIPFPSTESFSFLEKKIYDPFVLGEIQDEKEFDLSVDIQMVCFCDIPVRVAKAHSDIYGKYAIVFSKNGA